MTFTYHCVVFCDGKRIAFIKNTQECDNRKEMLEYINRWNGQAFNIEKKPGINQYFYYLKSTSLI